MIIYCITLFIWISVNIFADKPVYAEQSEILTRSPQICTAETTTLVSETSTETTTQGFDISIPAYLENYVIGAVAAEMPVYFENEALKAQAVACRTYACREYFNNKNTDLKSIGQAYFSKDELKKRWGDDTEKNYEKIEKAVTDTRGELMLYQNQPILAAFCSASGGMTEDSGNLWGTSLPYLRPVNSEYDKNAPVYMQNVNISLQRLAAALGVNDASDISIEKRSASGYVLSVKAGGREFSGDDIRRLLGLRSSDFYIEINGDTAYFTAHGYGHGIGMSQYGAEFMARDGMDYKKILLHYYTGVSIKAARIEN